MQRKKSNRLTWIVIVVVHLLVFFAGLNTEAYLSKDSLEYFNQAENLRSHLTFYCGDWDEPLQPELFSLRPPGYGLFLAVFSIGNLRIVLPLIIQLLLSLATLYLAWKALVIIIGKSIHAAWFLFPLSAFVVQFIYAGTIMSEILFQFFIMGMICSALMFHHTSKLKWGILFQVVTTIAMLIKPVMWLFPILFFPAVIWMVFRMGYSRNLLVTFLIPFSVIVTMHIRNYVLTGTAEYTSVSRRLLINYNVAALLEARVGKEKAYYSIDSLQKSVASLSYAERNRIIDDYCRNQVMQSPGLFVKEHAGGLLRFFLDTGRWEWRRFFRTDENWKGVKENRDLSTYLQQWSLSAILYQLYCLAMNVFLLFTLVHFMFNKRIDVRDRRIIVALILYVAILTGPSASARFRLPVFPLQLITCGAFLISWQTRNATRIKL